MKQEFTRLTFSLFVGFTHKHTMNFFDEVTRQLDVHVLLSNPGTHSDVIASVSLMI